MEEVDIVLLINLKKKELQDKTWIKKLRNKKSQAPHGI
jgi:hypothetical protein